MRANKRLTFEKATGQLGVQEVPLKEYQYRELWYLSILKVIYSHIWLSVNQPPSCPRQKKIAERQEVTHVRQLS